ncbi:SH3 domain-binding protein 5-like isoform X2 [Clavelina lepadiformis]|uniref:SH3 domain-binding protein 5-like isoform X2 n=1 Tax=Clavelina lepadiformis TaxID=159417 RepID=UPI004042C7AA
MDEEPSLVWGQSSQPPPMPRAVEHEEGDSIPGDAEEFFKNIHGVSVEELEVELRRKEKELYLCSRLGLFLAQEVDELVSQRRGMVSDHTRVLLELQEYRDSRRSYLDLSDGASEHVNSAVPSRNPSFTLSPSSDIQRQHSGEKSTGHSRMSSLHSQVSDVDHPVLHRTVSIESLDLVSNAESTITTTSTRELHCDLDLVQRSHDKITKLEVHLDKTRAKYRSLMTHYAHKLKEMSRELGSCVNKARPYFDAVKKAKKCQHETQQAAMEYKRAVNLQKAARDMVKVAEDRVLAAEDKLDPTWQEMLNQANMKVNEASQEKNRVHRVHQKATKKFQVAEEKKIDLQMKLQRNIIKSKPYFEIQREFQDKLESTTKKLNLFELKLMEARQTYSLNLAKLRRSGTDDKTSSAMKSLSERGSGVGAENPLGLPKPALDFLEREIADSPDGASKTNSEDLMGDIFARTKLEYNPYDLLYLTDLGSDSASNFSDDGDYIQDF